MKKRRKSQGPKIKKLEGSKIDMLLVLNLEDVKFNGKRYLKTWKCKCDCGNIKNIREHYLLSKYDCLKSCGCFAMEKNRVKFIGDKHPSYKGGHINKSNGYKEVHIDGEKKLEHRHIYETHYGVKLKPHQNVHHINGDRADNRIENLELWDVTQPSGQRVEDKIKFYFQLVQEYKDHPEYKHLFI